MTALIGELDFLTKLQRILNEGLFVASYKYALLLALAELSVEKDAAADGTLRIELDELAERFITLYWRQVAPFSGPNMLAQNTGKQAAVINRIATLRTSAPTLAVARNRKQWPKLVQQLKCLATCRTLCFGRDGDEEAQAQAITAGTVS